MGMTVKVRISDPKLVRVLEGQRNRSKFVREALAFYVEANSLISELDVLLQKHMGGMLGTIEGLRADVRELSSSGFVPLGEGARQEARDDDLAALKAGVKGLLNLGRRDKR